MSPQDDSLTQRGKALEEVFFRNVDAKLLEDLKRSAASEEMRTDLIRRTGIQDETLINELIHQGVTSEGLVALRLIPMVMVAWADRHVTEAEHKTILDEAAKQGIEVGSIAHRSLEAWLQLKPESELIDAWERYTKELLSGMGPAARQAFSSELQEELMAVAKASGGVLGFGAVSDAESQVIDRVMKIVA
ncbi:hypothetical protein SH139x_005610 [Planctomycetaceae bacterium SH139]